MDNGWVLFGYAVTYGAITLYAIRIVVRTRRMKRNAEGG